MSKPTLYLAGAMSGLSWDEAMIWRRTVRHQLEHKWRIINPVAPQLPFRSADRSEIIIAANQNDVERVELHMTATGICAQDEFFIDQSDWVFANFLDAKKVSIGSVWEMGYAWGKGKKILSVIDKGSLHDHPFVRRRSHLFTDNLEDAIDYFAKIAV